MLELWGMQSTPILPLCPVDTPGSVLSVDEIELFDI